MKCATVLLVVAALIANAPPAQAQCGSDSTASRAWSATAAEIPRYHDYGKFTGAYVQLGLVYTDHWE